MSEHTDVTDHGDDANPPGTDDDLYAVVRRVWEERDPVPAGLVARLQATAALAASDTDLDLELMTLVERSHELVGARGSGSQESSYTLRFALGGVDLLVRVQGPDGPRTVDSGVAGGGARIDCWLVPPSPVTVWVLTGTDPNQIDGRTVAVDATGRFEVTHLAAGMLRLRIEPQDSPAFVTPAFEI